MVVLSLLQQPIDNEQSPSLFALLAGRVHTKRSVKFALTGYIKGLRLLEFSVIRYYVGLCVIEM